MKKLFLLVLIALAGVLLAPAADAQEMWDGRRGQPLFAAAACIESPVVQDTPIAASMGVGNRFRAGGMTYLITTGTPSCRFNCHMGFDINCDGKLGDYCPVSLNLSRVSDVKKCLELRAAAPPAPATPAAPAAPDAEPTTVLAHTGSTTDSLFEASLALLALGGGASAYAVRRRRNDG